MVELRRVEVIVFDGVSGAVGFDLSQCRYLMDSLELRFHRHRGGETIEIHLIGVFTLRLYKEWMMIAVREHGELRFY